MFILSHCGENVIYACNTVSTVAFKIADGFVGCGEITGSC